MSLLLTDEDLHELTGYRMAKCQVAWLKARKWIFDTNAAGQPRVARAYFELRMVGQQRTEAPAPETRHNFAALRLVK